MKDKGTDEEVTDEEITDEEITDKDWMKDTVKNHDFKIFDTDN
jgi:hypothetical protein